LQSNKSHLTLVFFPPLSNYTHSQSMQTLSL